MPSGSKPGERRGGRQKGTPNKRTLELLGSDEGLGEGVSFQDGDETISPKAVMLRAMRAYWRAGRIAEAVECAARVAPFEHPRLSAIDARLDTRSSYVVEDAGQKLAEALNRLRKARDEEAAMALGRIGRQQVLEHEQIRNHREAPTIDQEPHRDRVHRAEADFRKLNRISRN
jgi:hypothetical protein